MFYSNALSVMRILLKIKKKSNQFEGGGEKERVAGGGKGAEKGSKSIRRCKKECPREVFCLLLGHSVLLDDNVVDKLFSF